MKQKVQSTEETTEATSAPSWQGENGESQCPGPTAAEPLETLGQENMKPLRRLPTSRHSPWPCNAQLDRVTIPMDQFPRDGAGAILSGCGGSCQESLWCHSSVPQPS